MKTKSNPISTKSPNYLEYAILKGLTKEQKKYAKSQVEKFESIGVAIPYGMIRTQALQIKK